MILSAWIAKRGIPSEVKLPQPWFDSAWELARAFGSRCLGGRKLLRFPRPFHKLHRSSIIWPIEIVN